MRRPNTHTAARRARAAALVAAAGAALAAGACRGSDDGRDAEREEVRRAAEEAAQLATGDSTRAARRGRQARDTGRGVQVGLGDGGRLARGDDPPLGPGDLRVTSTDGAVVYALIGDTVRMRLGDSLGVKVRRDVDAGADSANGLGGLVSRTVKAAVGGAVGEVMRFSVRLPVADIEDVRYEDGELHLAMRGDRGGRGHKNGGSSARFAREDAERFAAAVRARQREVAAR